MGISVRYNMKIKGKGGGESTSDPYTFDDEADLLAFTKDSLITIALDALREEQNDGFDLKPVLVVDNVRGRGLQDVSPFGKIQFIARAEIKDILQFAFTSIERLTKIKTGNYKNHSVVTHNGVQVATDRGSFDRWLANLESQPNDRFRFVNSAPYARKLERYGVTANSAGIADRKLKYRSAKKHEKRKGGTKYLVPNGVYALSYRALDRRYSANAFIRFDQMPGGALGIGSAGSFKTGNSAGKPYLYPTILIQATESGLKG